MSRAACSSPTWRAHRRVSSSATSSSGSGRSGVMTPFLGHLHRSGTGAGGLTEAQARKKLGRRVSVLRQDFAGNDRAQTGREAKGFVKVMAGPRGRIVGASIVGPQAGEQIAFWALAISQGLSLSGRGPDRATLSDTGRSGKKGRHLSLCRSRKEPYGARRDRVSQALGVKRVGHG